MKSNKLLCSCCLCRNIITSNNLSIHYDSKQCKTGKLFSSYKTDDYTGVDCRYCGKTCKSNNSRAQHELRCDLNPNHLSLQYLKNRGAKGQGVIDPTPCEFCNKVHHTKSSLNNHRIRCPKNPNRKHEKLTDEGRERIRTATRNKSQKQWADPEFRKRHQKSMQKAVKNNPESYTSSNRGRTKQIEYDGIKFQGQWELDFYKWAKEQGLNPQRPNKGFPYHWNGDRTYFPDFYIGSMSTYVEVKGYETDRDRAKWDQFPERLIIIKEQQIKEIRKGIFKGIDQ